MKKDSIKYIISILTYGTIGLLLRYIRLPSEIVVLCRGAIGALVIWLFVRLRGRHTDLPSIRRSIGWLVLSGVCLGLNWVFLFAAYIQTTVAIASLCNYLAPVVVVLLAPFLYREKIGWGKLLCVAAALVGVVLISGVLERSSSTNLLGVVFALLAAACFVGIILCNRKLTAIDTYDKAIVQLAVSAITVLPFALLKNWGTPLILDTRTVLLTLMLGFVHTGFAYCLYFDALGKLPVHSVAILGYLEPVVAVLCSVFLLQEGMSLLGWVGAALIIGAAIASELQKE